MTIEILAGGQTGVDLGAHLAALEAGVAIGGFMPADGRNEKGLIPEHVALHLRRHNSTNPAARTRANVSAADAALVIVPDRRRTGVTRGTALTIRLCEDRIRRGPRPGGGVFALLVVDPGWSSDVVSGWVATWPDSLLASWRDAGRTRPLRVMVAGPRASLWPDGEAQARRFVDAICRAVKS